MPDETTNGHAELTANEAFEQGLRLGIRNQLGESGFQDRDRYEAFGWEIDPSEEEYAAMYLRNPFASGLIDKPAQLAWRRPPEVDDQPDADGDTEFQQRVQKLARSHDFWSYLSRTQRAAGFGEYALLFVDFDDTSDPSELDSQVDMGDADLDSIRGFKVIPQFAVDERDWGEFGDDRWGEPTHYHVDWSENVTDDLNDDATETAYSRIHHSRVVEVPSQPPLTRENQSRPRIERLLNPLYDIEKILGSTAEATYRGVDKGLHINFDPSEVDPSALQDSDQTEKIRDWYHGLQPTLETVGGEVTDLGGDINDPTGALDAELKALSAATGFSKQFIEGAAAGEIASSETNMRNDFGEIREQQQQYIDPYLLRRGLWLLIDAGTLATPDGGRFEVEWPDLFELSDEEVATIEQKRSQTAKNLGIMGQRAETYVEDGEFPEDEGPEQPLDEANPQVLEQFERMQGRDADGEEMTRRDVLANATQYSEGDWVQTPQGIGVIGGIRTEPFTGKGDDEVAASSDSPTYEVGLRDGRVAVEFYKASQLDAAGRPDELEEIENPVDDVSSNNLSANTALERLASLLGVRSNDWTMPDTWRESDIPARLILLDAWSSMGGQFDCGGSCCKSELGSDRLCAAMKDEFYGGWTGWRDGG